MPYLWYWPFSGADFCFVLWFADGVSLDMLALTVWDEPDEEKLGYLIRSPRAFLCSDQQALVGGDERYLFVLSKTEINRSWW